MASSTINQMIELFRQAFSGSGHALPMPEIERLGILVHRAMGSPKRVYHSSRHVIEVSAGAPPLRTLAALFHDLVYYQLDGGFPAQFADLLGVAIRTVDGKFIVKTEGLSHPHLQLCADVFGFADGHELSPFGGLNEFASALVAAEVLSPYLTLPQVLSVTACIEATIPFRPCGEDGTAAAQMLRKRLAVAAERHNLAIDDPLLDDWVREAVAMANQDVRGFAEFDPGVFLANTWQLIEESNAALSAVGVYSIRDYRQALARMEGFLSQLNPQYIFQNYQSLLSAEQHAVLRDAAASNLDFARRYLAAKLLVIAIVEAIASETGGDCPVAMLLGDFNGNGSSEGLRVERLLPQPVQAPDCDVELLDVLRYGRSADSVYDQSKSPLSAFIYCRFGEAGSLSHFAQAKAMFAGALAASDFLARLDGDVVAALAHGCAAISVSRRERLEALSRRFAAQA